jgi:hydroxymethylglutaryl-CoA reductase (NADPH)
MALIPRMILRQLYTRGSMENISDGVTFEIKNRLTDVEVTGVPSIIVNGRKIPSHDLTLTFDDGRILTPDDITADNPLSFPLRKTMRIAAKGNSLEKGKYKVEIVITTDGFGKLAFDVEDSISERADVVRIPRDNNDDYGESIIKKRQEFVEKLTGKKPEHITHYSFDPSITKGNIEHFTGVAQIPIGFAGPLTAHGDHAQGDFLRPMATTEGTLVASYNRGIKVLNLSGGVHCSIVGDAMQRAPVFVFDSAREARDFVKWVEMPENFARIKEEAEATSSVAKLQYIDSYLASKFAYLRFNYSTGDAAGQNMVGRATFAACSWVLDNYEGIVHFFLESNFATDKKASQINIMRTRGKRVTAECTVKRDVLIEQMRVEPENLAYMAGVANVGSILSGANNNGLHSANGITAMFIATGQDVANVSESSAGIIYVELTEEKDLYISITIPSLIVASYGGGVGLATQRECLEFLDCYGKNKVNKFAEIVAGVVLAGEISLASAITSLDWVSSHEKYGRNR